MGLIVSYFRRPKDAVAELEGIESKLGRLETWRQSQLRFQKRLLGYSLMLFLIGYPVSLAVYYAYCLPATANNRLVLAAHAAAFLAVLPLFYGLRRCLLWLFVRSLANCESRMTQLRQDKQKVLDRVMDTETYKRAKEILDRFDPDRFKAEFQQHQQQQQKQDQSSSAVKLGQFFNKSPLSKRPAAAGAVVKRAASNPPTAPGGVILRELSALPSPQQQQHPQQSLPPLHQPAQLPRPVLARDRSTMDRLLDLLVGDGADRRYALICRRCCGHNGMALAEEFPYLAWRCAYCAMMHAPRQVRPQQQPLESPQSQFQQHRRPQQWQSLMDLRPSAASTNAAASGTLPTTTTTAAVASSASSSPSQQHRRPSTDGGGSQLSSASVSAASSASSLAAEGPPPGRGDREQSPGNHDAAAAAASVARHRRPRLQQDGQQQEQERPSCSSTIDSS